MQIYSDAIKVPLTKIDVFICLVTIGMKLFYTHNTDNMLLCLVLAVGAQKKFTYCILLIGYCSIALYLYFRHT